MSADPPDPLIGSTLSQTYVIVSLLGEGGMGTVYLAKHTRIAAKRFAIKILHAEFAEHAEALARFKREAEATALISSPHVIGVHDVGTTPDGRPFMVCDYLEGEELGAVLERQGQLPMGEAVRIVRQICLGLTAAHERGVIHRDVKPENVHLVGPKDATTAKLLDFGISRLDDHSSKLTQAGVALGTPDYMSPEQARGKPIDHRSDIYAAGLLLYVALTGVSPFERNSPQETLMALLTEEVPPPNEFDASIPPDLEAVVMRAIAKDPAGRFQTVAELHRALAPYDPTAAPLILPPAPPQSLPQSLPFGPPSSMPDKPVSSVSKTQPDLPEGEPTGSAPALVYASDSAVQGQIIRHVALGAVAAFGALLLGLGGLLRAAEVNLGIVAWMAIGAVLAVGLGTAIFTGRAQLLRTAWTGPPAARMARIVGRAVVGGIATYALTIMATRALQIIVLAEPKTLGSPLFDILALLAASATAAIVVLTGIRATG